MEFTKDSKLGLEGDCIIGVKADFSLLQLKKFIKSLNNNKITIIIETINEEYNNKDYNEKIKINKNNINKIRNNYDYNNSTTINNKNNNEIEIDNKINNSNGNLILENKIIEKINAEVNPKFNSDKEIVIRKTDFVSERTFAIRANKAAFELNNGLIEFLKLNYNEIKVTVESRE